MYCSSEESVIRSVALSVPVLLSAGQPGSYPLAVSLSAVSLSSCIVPSCGGSQLGSLITWKFFK